MSHKILLNNKFYILLICISVTTFLFHPGGLVCQTIISGKLTNERDEPASNVNILIYPHQSQSLIAFAISNRDGKYSIR